MQTEKHSPEALTIEEVFTAARHYRVPVYQRAYACLLYTSPSPRDVEESRMPSSA